MITINTIFDSSRHELINKWLDLVLEGHDFTLTNLAADAGARRYFRITLPNEAPLVLMDAPVTHNDAKQFTSIAHLLGSNGIHVPSIVHANFEDGLLLLSDLGDETYLRYLKTKMRINCSTMRRRPLSKCKRLVT